MDKTDRLEMEVSIKTRSHLRYTDFLHEVLKKLESHLDLEESRTDWLALSLREAVNNAVIHGNKNVEEKWVQVDFIVSDSSLTIKVWDEGEGFSPEVIDDPTKPENLYKPRGRGVFLIKKFVDDFTFTRSQDGRFGVIMTARLGQEPAKEDSNG